MALGRGQPPTEPQQRERRAKPRRTSSYSALYSNEYTTYTIQKNRCHRIRRRRSEPAWPRSASRSMAKKEAQAKPAQATHPMHLSAFEVQPLPAPLARNEWNPPQHTQRSQAYGRQYEQEKESERRAQRHTVPRQSSSAPASCRRLRSSAASTAAAARCRKQQRPRGPEK